jgi:hypothetical protein
MRVGGRLSDIGVLVFLVMLNALAFAYMVVYAFER